MQKLGIKIVVIGGGTGSFTLLKSLKEYTPNITALVNMADDGGSTGVLRDELGVLPPGDVRQCLVALSESEKLRELFNYRFDEGTFKGHAFGNLFLTALEKMTGNFAEAVETASSVLNITGRVEPVTLDQVHLVMHHQDGTKTDKQYEIGHMDFGGQSQPRLSLEPSPVLNPAAAAAIEAADLVVIAPGNLYASLAPALLVPGISKALNKTKAKKVYVCNLVTKPGQTDGFEVHDFASEIERFADFQLDYVLYNRKKPTKAQLERYAGSGELPVEYNEATLQEQHYDPKGGSFISSEFTAPNSGKSDPLASTRTLIRHDGEIIAKALMKIYFS